MSNVKCPFCGSEEILRFQRDADWGGGSYYDTVNGSDDCYDKNKDYSVPDVDIFHCRTCESFFDPHASLPTMEVVPVYALQDAINNLEKHIRWLTTNYKDACRTVQVRIQQASYKDMATKIPRDFPDLEKTFAEIDKYNEQVKLLSHIIEKSKVSLHTIQTDINKEVE